MRHYQLLAAQLESLGPVITELSLDELDQVSIRFDSGLFLLLGAKDLSHRVARFLRLWEGPLPSRPSQGLTCGMSMALLSDSATKDWPCRPQAMGVRVNEQFYRQADDCRARYRDL